MGNISPISAKLFVCEYKCNHSVAQNFILTRLKLKVCGFGLIAERMIINFTF